MTISSTILVKNNDEVYILYDKNNNNQIWKKLKTFNYDETLHLTNKNSLITDGDILCKDKIDVIQDDNNILYKYENINTDINNFILYEGTSGINNTVNIIKYKDYIIYADTDLLNGNIIRVYKIKLLENNKYEIENRIEINGNKNYRQPQLLIKDDILYVAHYNILFYIRLDDFTLLKKDNTNIDSVESYNCSYDDDTAEVSINYEYTLPSLYEYNNEIYLFNKLIFNNNTYQTGYYLYKLEIEINEEKTYVKYKHIKGNQNYTTDFVKVNLLSEKFESYIFDKSNFSIYNIYDIDNPNQKTYIMGFYKFSLNNENKLNKTITYNELPLNIDISHRIKGFTLYNNNIYMYECISINNVNDYIIKFNILTKTFKKKQIHIADSIYRAGKSIILFGLNNKIFISSYNKYDNTDILISPNNLYYFNINELEDNTNKELIDGIIQLQIKVINYYSLDGYAHFGYYCHNNNLVFDISGIYKENNTYNNTILNIFDLNDNINLTKYNSNFYNNVLIENDKTTINNLTEINNDLLINKNVNIKNNLIVDKDINTNTLQINKNINLYKYTNNNPNVLISSYNKYNMIKYNNNIIYCDVIDNNLLIYEIEILNSTYKILNNITINNYNFNSKPNIYIKDDILYIYCNQKLLYVNLLNFQILKKQGTVNNSIENYYCRKYYDNNYVYKDTNAYFYEYNNNIYLEGLLSDIPFNNHYFYKLEIEIDKINSTVRYINNNGTYNYTEDFVELNLNTETVFNNYMQFDKDNFTFYNFLSGHYNPITPKHILVSNKLKLDNNNKLSQEVIYNEYDIEDLVKDLIKNTNNNIKSSTNGSMILYNNNLYLFIYNTNEGVDLYINPIIIKYNLISKEFKIKRIDLPRTSVSIILIGLYNKIFIYTPSNGKTSYDFNNNIIYAFNINELNDNSNNLIIDGSISLDEYILNDYLLNGYLHHGMLYYNNNIIIDISGIEIDYVDKYNNNVFNIYYFNDNINLTKYNSNFYNYILL